MNDYRIGDMVFRDRKEYNDALSDLQKIKDLKKVSDLSKTKEAAWMYDLVRNDKITFRSEQVRELFLRYLSDNMARDTLDEEKNSGTGVSEDAFRKRMIQIVIGTVLMTVAVVLLIVFLKSSYDENKSMKELQDLQKQTTSQSETPEGTSSTEGAADTPDASGQEETDAQQTADGQTNTDAQQTAGAQEEPAQETADAQGDSPDREILAEYQKRYEQNSDLIGWLTIDGTQIDYPVMQTTDNSYYLNRNFSGETDKNGLPFLDYRNRIDGEDTNYIIYGHNMSSGAMFGSLKNYINGDYLSAHSLIHFNTIYEKQDYQIVAVCLSKVADADAAGFRYYNFIRADNQEEYDRFVKNITSLNVSGNKVVTEESDHFLTLSTCSSYVEDGRLFLVAKRV